MHVMQRWMLWIAFGVVSLVLMFFGAKYARHQYYLGKPDKVWVPLPLREGISVADQKKIADQIREKLHTDTILRKVVIDVGLKEKFKQPTEDAAVKELARRLFVEVGSAETPNGSMPSVNIGLSGIGHEHAVLGEAATRIIKDVWVIIGIDPITGKRLEQPSLLPPSAF